MIIKVLRKKLTVMLFVCSSILITVMSTISGAGVQPVVLELFTSQGCSSCPPADRLLGRFASDSNVLPLSFHIDYWDRLGWKDVYSSHESTERQSGYAKAMGLDSIFTPQLVVDGAASVVGSNESAVREAINRAAGKPREYDIAIVPEKKSGGFDATVAGIKPASAGIESDIFEVRFVSRSSTDVKAGENTGRRLESINNVTSINLIGRCSQHECSYKLSSLGSPDDGIAVIAQSPRQGQILGAAAYRQ